MARYKNPEAGEFLEEYHQERKPPGYIENMRLISSDFKLADKLWRVYLKDDKIILGSSFDTFLDSSQNKQYVVANLTDHKLVVVTRFALVIFAKEIAEAQDRGQFEIDWSTHEGMKFLNLVVGRLIEKERLC